MGFSRIGKAQFGGSTAERRALHATVAENVLDILGTTGTILPIGSSLFEAADFTTVTGVGDLQPVFTYQGTGRDAWDALAGATGPVHIPTVTFNGVDEEADSPDNAYWSRAGAAFSVGAWVNATDPTNSAILSKFQATGDLREWRFILNASDKAQLILSDEDDAVTPNATIDTEIDVAVTASTWTFIVFTYDGTANASGINGYIDGALAASTDTDDANFASLRDTTAVVELGDTEDANFFDGMMAGGPLGPFFTQVELTADAVRRLYQLGRVQLGV